MTAQNLHAVTKLVLIGKRFFWLTILLIYLGGTCNDIIVRSSHEIYHFITHTLHQHHHHSHVHGHTHNHFIDEALSFLDMGTENENSPTTPPNSTQVKFPDHLLKTSPLSCIAMCECNQSFTSYLFAICESVGEPQIPPPKFS